MPLPPFPGSPKFLPPTLSGGSAELSCPELWLWWSVQAGLLQPCVSLVLQSLKQPRAAAAFTAQAAAMLRSSGWAGLFPWSGAARGDLPGRLFFLCKSEFVLSTTSTCSQVGLFISGSFWEGAAQYFLHAINVLLKVTPDFQ